MIATDIARRATPSPLRHIVLRSIFLNFPPRFFVSALTFGVGFSTRAVTPRIGLHSRGSVVRLEHAGRRISTPFQPSYDPTIPWLTTHDGGSKVEKHTALSALEPGCALA
eukprot:410756-Rhodomonas_salina.1